jgi:hypothetical protein
MASQALGKASLLGDVKEEQPIDYKVVGEEQRRRAIEEVRTELNFHQTINHQKACLKKLRASVRGATETEMEFLSRFNCLEVSEANFRNASCSRALRTKPADVNLA